MSVNNNNGATGQLQMVLKWNREAQGKKKDAQFGKRMEKVNRDRSLHPVWFS